MPKVILQSSDGESYDVDVEVAKMSSTIKTMLDDLGVSVGEGDDEVIPLPNVRGSVLKRVIEWCLHHRVDHIPLKFITFLFQYIDLRPLLFVGRPPSA